MRVAALVVLAVAVGDAAQQQNMNGEYVLAEMAGADPSKQHFLDFSSRPGVKYFDVYSQPIKTLYSQVYWTTQPSVDLPAEVVERYKDSSIAIVGFEVNQVRRTAKGDVGVPLNAAYNHHFESSILGTHSRLVQRDLTKSDNSMAGHGYPDPTRAWVAEDLGSPNGAPSSAAFGAANGGEHRKSYHGFGPGYAHQIYAPEKFVLTPMQIDTWNRDKMNLTGSPFVPGPVPRNSLAPTSGPDAIYSGLLECPVTTRITKVMPSAYSVNLASPKCPYPITTSADCFAAAPKLGLPADAKLTNKVVSTGPQGCSVVATAQGEYDILFNSNTSTASCAAATKATAVHQATTVDVDASITLDPATSTATISLSGPLPPFLIVATALSALVWVGVMVWACRRRRERMRTHGHGLGSHTGPLLAPDIQRL